MQRLIKSMIMHAITDISLFSDASWSLMLPIHWRSRFILFSIWQLTKTDHSISKTLALSRSIFTNGQRLVHRHVAHFYCLYQFYIKQDIWFPAVLSKCRRSSAAKIKYKKCQKRSCFENETTSFSATVFVRVNLLWTCNSGI